MGVFKITGYHGTDKSVADAILRDGFVCKQNTEHWLGNGIYFFADESLAKWWATNPTQKHGVRITEPAIIECLIEADEQRVLNLCSLDAYQPYVKRYNEFTKSWIRAYRVKNEINFRQLRCLFFDYLFTLYDIDVMIAPFLNPDQPYMPPFHDNSFSDQMHIMYTEVQICVHPEKQEVIKSKVLKEVNHENN